MGAHLIERKLFAFLMTSGPTGVMGVLAKLVKRPFGSAVKACWKVLRLLAHQVPSSSEKLKGNLKEMGKLHPVGVLPPVNMFNDYVLALRHLI